MRDDSRNRVIIEGVEPEIDCGRFPAKRTIGEKVVVEADVFTDGHDAITAYLLYRRDGDLEWTETPMVPLVNDRWRGEFAVRQLGHYRYSLKAWVDRFGSWRRDMGKKVAAGQDVSVELLVGAQLAEDASRRATDQDTEKLQEYARVLRKQSSMQECVEFALGDPLARIMNRYPDTAHATAYGRELEVVVDRERARFSSWYELFPRSTSPEPGRHGTFKDVEARLPYVADMGFDVLYLPPIHPVGYAHRKGKNNARMAGPGDPGSPWGIGSREGGHKAIHPELGTAEDFRRLVAKAQEFGMEVALDVAFQASPDHPYVQEHPEWFYWRPDGTVQYAENPPKKYEDIYPINFVSDRWRELWEELKSVFLHWIEQGVRIFRVDNPHTKPFPYWEWLISEIKSDYPEVIFLAEAFTRPKVMYRLAKLGFTQSYTYFAWRNTKSELVQYFTELTQTKVKEFFRPNLWPNTPDILTEYLQHGGRPAFAARLVLAATLGASYGIYGPAFELRENEPREPGSEEYLHSEKYEIRQWDLNAPDSLRDFIARVNRIRRENAALQTDRSLRFHFVDNDQLICYSKVSEDGANAILVVANLDPYHVQSGWVDLDLSLLDLEPDRPYQVHDLISDARYLWHGSRNYVELIPT